MFNCKPNEFMVIVVYWKPSDFPEEFVARAQYTHFKTKKVRTDKHYFASKSYLDIFTVLNDAGYTRVARFPDDDPKILETWL